MSPKHDGNWRMLHPLGACLTETSRRSVVNKTVNLAAKGVHEAQALENQNVALTKPVVVHGDLNFKNVMIGDDHNLRVRPHLVPTIVLQPKATTTT